MTDNREELVQIVRMLTPEEAAAQYLGVDASSLDMYQDWLRSDEGSKAFEAMYDKACRAAVRLTKPPVWLWPEGRAGWGFEIDRQLRKYTKGLHRIRQKYIRRARHLFPQPWRSPYEWHVTA